MITETWQNGLGDFETYDEDTAIRLVFHPTRDAFVGAEDWPQETQWSLEDETRPGGAAQDASRNGPKNALIQQLMESSAGRYALSRLSVGNAIRAAMTSGEGRDTGSVDETTASAFLPIEQLVPIDREEVQTVDEMIDQVRDHVGVLKTATQEHPIVPAELIGSSKFIANQASDMIDQCVSQSSSILRRRELLLENYLELMKEISSVQICEKFQKRCRLRSARVRSTSPGLIEAITRLID